MLHPPLALVALALALFLASCSSAPQRGSGPSYSGFSEDIECEDFSENYGKIILQRLRTRDGRCEIAVKPSTIRNDRFRTYGISSTGSLIVFNSYGGGFGNNNNATRSFFLFPRVTPPIFSGDSGEDVVVRVSADETIRFSASTGRISEISGGLQFREDPALNRSNRGGLELLSYPRGLILDAGWQYGGIAHAHPSKESTFIDPVGNRCAVRNRDLFEMRRDEPYLRFKSDPELVSFLEERCPQLNLGPLKERI